MTLRHRFHEIDLLRGIACLMVVAFHYLYRGQQARWLSESPGEPVMMLASYGYLGVHLFFIISGFVIFMSAEGASVRSFAVSRAARLYPALWIAAPLTALVAIAFASPYFQVSASTVIVNMSLVPHWFGVEFVDGAYWSLVVELHFYILVALAVATGLIRRAEWLLAGWLLVSAANLVRPMFPAEFWLAAKWAPLFTAGACAYLIRSRGLTSARAGLWLAAYALSLVYALKPIVLNEGGDGDGASALATGVLITLFHLLFAAIAFDRWRMAASPLTLWAGLLTYPVYLVHQNLGYVVIEAMAPVLQSFALRVALTTVVVGLLAWAIVVLIERPGSRWIRQSMAPRPA